MASDNRLIVALDVSNALQGMSIVEKLGDSVSFYKIGLGMLTGGGMALANELKQELGKEIFMDLKLFDIGTTIERAVRGITSYEIDFLTVQGDPQVIQAAQEGKGDKHTKILAVTFLTSLDRTDLDNNFCKISFESFASVNKNASIVAISGAIIPEPLAIPAIVTSVSPI